MSESQTRNGLDEDSRRPIAVLALAAGVFSTALLLSAAPPAKGTVEEQLAFVASHRGGYLIVEFAVLFWTVTSAAFVAGLGGLLGLRAGWISPVAVVLSAGGILLLGFATYVSIGSSFAIIAAGRPAVAGEDAYHALFWRQMGILLTDPPLMAWGAGQIFFARALRRTDVLPRWLAWTATVAGAAGVLASLQAPPVGVLLALLTVAGFAVWSAGAGVCLLRSQRS